MLARLKSYRIHLSVLAIGAVIGATGLGYRPALAESKTCSQLESELFDALGWYFSAADEAVRKPGQYRRAHERLSAIMWEALPTACFERLSEIYLSSAFMSGVRLRKPKHYDGPELTTRSPQIRSALEVLVRQKRIRPLTPEIREELGGDWNRFVDHGERYTPLLMGAYDCQTGIIWYDPFLPPYNLTGVIMHEIDHLLRDKLTLGTSWAKNGSLASVEEWIIIDEVLANIMGAVTQYRLFTDNNRDYPFQRQRKWSLGPRFSNENYLRLAIPNDLDLSLFSRDGALALTWTQLFDSLEKNWTTEQKRQIRKDIHRINELRFSYGKKGLVGEDLWSSSLPGLPSIPIFGGFNEVYKGFVTETSHPNIVQMVNIVAKAYFPGRPIDAERIAHLIQKGLRNPVSGENFSPLHAGLSFLYEESSPDFNDLQQVLNSKPTPGCLAMSEWNAEHPRPTKEGVRPLEEGVRPTKEGVRPLEEGVRPTKEGVRPCEWPDEKL